MTLEKLLGGSPEYLKSLSDTELETWAAQYWKVTRMPIDQEKKSKGQSVKGIVKTAAKNNKMDELKRRYKEMTGEDFD